MSSCQQLLGKNSTIEASFAIAVMDVELSSPIWEILEDFRNETLGGENLRSPGMPAGYNTIIKAPIFCWGQAAIVWRSVVILGHLQASPGDWQPFQYKQKALQCKVQQYP